MPTDDIVTRLREDRENTIEDWWLLEPMCTDAADEIERLRAVLSVAQSRITELENNDDATRLWEELKQWRYMADDLYHASKCTKKKCQCMKFKQQNYEWLTSGNR